jgi:tight adherence protein B
MLLLLTVVFLGIFIVVALLLVASGTGASQRTKQTLNRLASTLAVGTRELEDQYVDIRKHELLSAIPWMNRWLLKIELAPRLRSTLYQADVKWTAGGLLLICTTCFLIPTYLVHLRTGVLGLSLLIGLLLGFAPFAYVLHKRSRRLAKFEAQLPDALNLMVSALRAGHSLVAALGLVGSESEDPVGGEFKIACDEQNYGLELRTALDNLVSRVPLQDIRIVTTAILIQKESGGNLAEVLDKTAYVIRERFRLKRQVRIHTAQGRLTGWILSFLPLVLGVALYFVNPNSMSLLWKRDIGIRLLEIAAVMTVVGALIIRKIVRMEV